jgi:predicted anti-sigma-YlaC factor YlaD
MDAAGHESLSQAIVARTSGGGCAAARERLCDFVDETLAPFDRSLVDGHLAHCEACAGLAAALAEATSVLASFATLEPRMSVVAGVLSATSRRRAAPTFGERASAWMARAATRPRFSLEVAYVLTVLLLVVLGNPVAAFKEASVRVQPRVTVVARAVSGPLAQMRTAGEATLTNVERAVRPKTEPADVLAQGKARLWQLWETYVDAPVRVAVRQVQEWAGRVVSEVRMIFGGPAGEPSAGSVR